MPKDNSKYDLYNDYHENGQIKSEVYYLGDKREGKWTHWDENGNRVLESHFKNDKAHGTWTYWYENGQKQIEENFKNDIKDGKYTQWLKDGQIDLEMSYKKGKENGITTRWDMEGNVIARIEYKNDELVWSYPQNTNKNFNIGALEGKAFVIPDKEISEVIKVFPKELLHTPFMNLWLTWHHFNENLAADPEHEHLKDHIDAYQLLSIQHKRMMEIIPTEHWNEISKEYYPDETSEWWLDGDKLFEACQICGYKHPPSYEGFIQDDAGFRLAYDLDHEFLGKWSLNPNDKFWKTEESFNRYYRYFSWRDKTGEELYNNLIETFGKNNLPPWADKIKNAD